MVVISLLVRLETVNRRSPQVVSDRKTPSDASLHNVLEVRIPPALPYRRMRFFRLTTEYHIEPAHIA